MVYLIIKKFLKDERGDSQIIDTAIALIFILGLFIGFVIYSNAAREKVIMNYSAKEGARTYMINKSESDGIAMAESYLNIGGIRGSSVSTGDNSIRIEKEIGIHVPFFQKGKLKLVSEVEFHEELDPLWYQKDIFQDGWYHERWRKSSAPMTRIYDDDAVDDPFRPH